ncbi:sigma-70 family RNA polymerase sigma factor [Novipirellula maiorica]|nr:sigma-70 family RNA polymerase sigma factor [Rhodopirellula maiorica]
MTEIYGPLVYYWCRQSGLGPEDSADIFQEVFRSLAANLASFKKENEGDKFRAYLWIITRNKIRDFAKVQSPKAKAEGGTDAYNLLASIPDDDDMAEENTSQSMVIGVSESLQTLLQEIKRDFKPATWDIFWRTVVDGQATAVVAEEFAVSSDSVYQAKSRVLRRIRAELGDVPF